MTQLSSLFVASAFCVHGQNEGVTYQSNSSSFSDLVDTSVPVKVVTNESLWAEGPICLPNGTFVFSEVWRNRAVSWTEEEGIQVISSPSDFENGNAVDAQGRIVATSQGKRAILRREINGTWITLVDHYDGKLLNGPDDVVVSRDGNIWFADSGFGLTDLNQGYGGKQEQDGLYYFRYNPATGEIVRLNTPEIFQPNGIAFSPDESILYVTDTPSSDTKGHIPKIYAYEVSGGSLKNGRLFKNVSPGIPDGIKVDELGNVWSSSAEGVHIYNSSGELLGKILVESLTATSNLAFGRDQRGRKWLYITATTRVLRLAVKVDGATFSKLDLPKNHTSTSSASNVSSAAPPASALVSANVSSAAYSSEKSSQGVILANGARPNTLMNHALLLLAMLLI